MLHNDYIEMPPPFELRFNGGSSCELYMDGMRYSVGAKDGARYRFVETEGVGFGVEGNGGRHALSWALIAALKDEATADRLYRELAEDGFWAKPRFYRASPVVKIDPLEVMAWIENRT